METNEVTAQVPLSFLEMIKEVSKDAAENSLQLMDDHIVSFGQQSKKNKHICEMYSKEIKNAQYVIDNITLILE